VSQAATRRRPAEMQFRFRCYRTPDTQGLLLGVVVHAASIQDADGAGSLLGRIKPLYCWLRAVFADGGYNRVPAILACFLLGLTLLIVSRPRGTKGFVLLLRRWVVTGCTKLPN